MNTSKVTFENSVELILSKYYLSCNLHIKLINTMAVAALGYRMQFVIFDYAWLEKIQKWTIFQISKKHSLWSYSVDLNYWAYFKGLLDLKALNCSYYISNLHKNLNKPYLIAYRILASLIGPDLNGFPNPALEFPNDSLKRAKIFLNQLDSEILFTPFIQEIALTLKKLNTLRPLSKEDISAINSKYNMYATDKMLTVSTPSQPFTPIPTQPIPSHSFTDGSNNRKKESMAMAIAGPLLPNGTFTKKVHGPFNSLELELQALEFSIDTAPELTAHFIFTNSESAITALCNFRNLNTNQRLKTVNRTTIRRILNKVEAKFVVIEHIKSIPTNPLNNRIYLYHIHSHMLENKAKREKYLLKHEDSLQSLLLPVLEGNEYVDRLASDGLMIANKNNPLLLTEGTDHWQLFNHLEDIPIYTNVKKYLYEKAMELGLKEFKLNKKAFSNRLFHPLTSTKLTTAIFKSKKTNLFSLADFIHKIIEKTLPTRNKVYLDLLSGTKKNSKKYKKNQKIYDIYNHLFCIPCLYLNNKINIEDTAHIFTNCPHYKDVFPNLIPRLLSIINKKIYPSILGNIPTWFSCSNDCIPLDLTEKNILDFPRELGDTGYIPKDLITWIKDWFPKLKQKKKLLKQLTIETQKTVQEKWHLRCDTHFQLLTMDISLPEEVTNKSNALDRLRPNRPPQGIPPVFSPLA